MTAICCLTGLWRLGSQKPWSAGLVLFWAAGRMVQAPLLGLETALFFLCLFTSPCILRSPFCKDTSLTGWGHPNDLSLITATPFPDWAVFWGYWWLGGQYMNTEWGDTSQPITGGNWSSKKSKNSWCNCIKRVRIWYKTWSKRCRIIRWRKAKNSHC